MSTEKPDAWPIRVPMSTFERFKKAVENISQLGWLAVGSKR